MKDIMSSFQQMQNQQIQTMNTFLGAMTQVSNPIQLILATTKTKNDSI